jgi:hypothetical protein
MVKVPGADTTGSELPVGVTVKPWLSIGPPLAVSPTKPVAPTRLVRESCAMLVPANVPPNVTWNPVVLNAPAPPKAAKVMLAPTGRMPRAPSVMVETTPEQPMAFVTESWLTSPRPLNVTVYPASVSDPMVTVDPASQPGTAVVPFTVSRTELVQVGLQVRFTIAIDGTSVLAEAPPNVRVNPPLPAPDEVTVPANPGMAFTAAATFVLVMGSPPFRARRSRCRRSEPGTSWWRR